MNVRTLVISALSIALLSVSALIALPVGAIPVTLQVAVVILIALIATPSQALFSIGGYIALGAIGLPIFSGGRGGIGVIAGPTGGFLWGFLLGAFLASLLSARTQGDRTQGDGSFVFQKEEAISKKRLEHKRTVPLCSDIAKSAIVIVVMYLCGWAQLVLITGMTPAQAFIAGVAPFIVFDVAKGVVAIIVARPIRKALMLQGSMRTGRS